MHNDHDRRKTGCMPGLMNRLHVRALAILIILCFSIPQAAPAAEHLTASGCSVSNVGYLTALAQEYERRTGVKIFVRGGGSVVGIEDLRSGKVDFAAACRPRGAGDPQEIEFVQVAWDALVFIVHTSNPVTNITLDNVRSIYAGRITDWRELGGPAAPIKVFVSRTRQGLSGVEASTKALVLKGEDPVESPNMLFAASSGIVEQLVEETPAGFATTGITQRTEAEGRHAEGERRRPHEQGHYPRPLSDEAAAFPAGPEKGKAGSEALRRFRPERRRPEISPFPQCHLAPGHSMKASLQTKVSVFVTLTILFISSFGTYLFTSAHHRSKEREFTVRGSALAYALSKAAEEGLIKEDLNLIKKASSVIKAPDVTRAQVYSNIWDAVDAFPLVELKTPPAPEAIRHFQNSTEPFVRVIAHGYDFYQPIFFRAFDNSEPTTIGFVRITLSSSSFEQELNNIAVTNITASLAMTLLAILAINLLIRRLVVRPIMSLHQSVAQFKDGNAPGEEALVPESTRELQELADAFRAMFISVRENESKLIESDRRIRSLFERVEHAIFRIDENGAIRESNGRFGQHVRRRDRAVRHPDRRHERLHLPQAGRGNEPAYRGQGHYAERRGDRHLVLPVRGTQRREGNRRL